MAIITPGRYTGTDFAPIDGKGRIAVPSQFRNNVPLNADGQRVLWCNYHEDLPCLIAYGHDQQDRLNGEVDADRLAMRQRDPGAAKADQFKSSYDFAYAYTLDESGRFLPHFSHRDVPEDDCYADLGPMSFAGGACAFVGAGHCFEIWWLPLLAQCDAANPRLRRVAAAWNAEKGAGRK
ncbi:MAG: division/cell wall cluster transcriptional repressor MraZ [Sphingopyxis sp.]|nr:division/cell wall cluster transcriptional repressor MraZ [Sphingopyxis sp.]